MKGEKRRIIPQPFHGGCKRRMECGTKTSKVHIEEGVKREKSCEIFSARPQQVVKSVM